MLFDGVGFHVHFLLLLDEFGELSHDLVGDILDMLAAPRRINPVDERYVGEFVGGGEADHVFPTRVGVLIDALHGGSAAFPARGTLRANIQVNILLKMPHGNKRTIVFDFHGFVGDCGDIVRSFQKQGGHICGEVIASEPESRVIGAKADAGIRLDLGLGDDGWRDFR